MFSDDWILVEKDSLIDPAANSGRSSEDDDDGAKVPIVDPTGKGATGISASEEADGL